MTGSLVRFVLACIVSLLPFAATAAESASVASRRSEATIVTEVDQVLPGQLFYAALRLRLAPGWHTYWKNPGNAGLAPSLSVTLSGGAEAGPILWPLPERIAEGPLTTYAYTGDVILPFTVTPQEGALAMQAHAEWLVCNDICVPEEADFAVTLPTGVPSPAPQAALIKAALTRVPSATSLQAAIDQDGVLTLAGQGLPAALQTADFFPTTTGVTQKAPVSILSVTANAVRLQLDAVRLGSAPQPGVLALTTASGSVFAFPIAPELANMAPKQTRGLAILLIAAVGGGFLLNFMPCVFPILAMKALAVARLSGTDRGRVRVECLSYSVGVLTAFIGLGSVLFGIQTATHISGWGFQFQSPRFVETIALLLFAVGLNLSGVFTVGEGLMGRGSGLGRNAGHLGSFFTGVLAVIVASPCSAPFMGTALAGALVLPAPLALGVFAALGFGLALPYLVLAAMPGATSVFPRPGAWMRTLQQLLAFPMYAAAVWLVWVVSQQAGPAGVLTVGVGAVAVGFAAWAVGSAQHGSGLSRPAAWLCLASSSLAVGALLFAVRPGPSPSENAEPYSAVRLDQLRAGGKLVFVNMTASWCLSCLVNEHLTLSKPAVRDAFDQFHVVYMKGDWTNQNPSISAFLHELGQDGVPLYVLFAAGHAPKVLPQLLSESIVLNALESAGS